jgi:nicotinamide-nucleotide amidase
VTSASSLVARLRERGATLAVAESLTGGLLIAEFVAVPGVSEVLRGGVVAYDTAVKRTVVGVDAALLAEHGPVHADVARQLAERIRTVLAVDGVPARVGLGTTGVAGPGPQGGHPAGTAFIAAAVDERVAVRALRLDGDRGAIRRAVVSESLVLLDELLDETEPGAAGASSLGLGLQE